MQDEKDREATQTEGADDRTRRRAYEIWEAEGRPENRAADHWAQAEAESGGGQPGGGESYGELEQPGGGQPEPGTDLPEALAQPGEGVPEAEPERQPPAATPGDGEAEATLPGAEGGAGRRRGGAAAP